MNENKQEQFIGELKELMKKYNVTVVFYDQYDADEGYLPGYFEAPDIHVSLEDLE